MDNKRHIKFLNTLQKMANDVIPVSSCRLASCITIGNEIISFGINKKKSHPLQAKYGKNPSCIWLHSEIDAIINALRHVNVDELSKATLYVFRVKYEMDRKRNRSNVVGLAAPCYGCKKAVIAFNFKTVVYSLDGGGYKVINR